MNRQDQSSLIAPEIKELLSAPDKREQLREIFKDMHPHEAYLFVHGLESSQIAEIITALGIPQGIEIFQEFHMKKKRDIFRFFPHEWMADVLEEMASDERADFIKALPKERTEEILPLVAQAERNEIKKLIEYKEDTAGSILTTEYASVSPEITVREALDKLRLQAFNRETIYYVYVIDEERKIKGIISLKNLLVSESQRKIKDVMHANVVTVSVDDDKEEAAKKLSDYDFLAIPVVDNNSRLVGIVTVDDVVDVVQQENTEDAYRYAAAGNYIDYMGSSSFHIAKQRITWLLVLVVMGFVSAWIMERYALQLQSIIALVFFLPLLTGSGGNAGTQSSTVIIRGLATGEVKMKDLGAVFKKELLIGVVVGVAMGLLAAFRAVVMNRSPLLGLTVGSAMIVTVTLATTLGAMLPLIFKRFKLDPALMSGPFIASIVDIITIIVYLEIAAVVFKISGI